MILFLLLSIKYGDGYRMHQKCFESLNEEVKKTCCAYYNFEERAVYNRPGAVINNDDDGKSDDGMTYICPDYASLSSSSS